MRNNIKIWTVFVLFTFFAAAVKAQDLSKRAIPIYTADSLKSGNYKDILTSFFQLAFNDLTGDNKAINFATNPFAVMLKNDPSLAIDGNYKKYKPLRKLNFGFGLKLDTSYKFSGFSSGIKYSLIDKRDATTSKLLFLRLQSDSIGLERDVLQDALGNYSDGAFPNAGDRNSADFTNAKLFSQKINSLFNSEVSFNQLDADFRKIVDSIVDQSHLNKIANIIKTNPGTSFKAVNVKFFDSLKNTIKNDLLWVVAISDTTYKNKFVFSNVVLSTELSKGFLPPKPGSNLELHIKSACNFLQDTAKTGNNLKRIIFNFEPAVNWVIRNNANDKSIFEFKLGGSYSHNFSSLYTNERRDILMMTSTLRVRIYQDIWIPLDIKYDPKTGNVLGLFNIKANFTGLGKFLKSQS